MLTISSIYKSKLCQASSQQLSKWPHNVQQGEKTGLGSGWGEEGPNFQSTSHLAFFLGPFSYQNIEESQNIYSEFGWRQKWLTMKCMRCTQYTWRIFGRMVVSVIWEQGEKWLCTFILVCLPWYIFRRSRAMRRLTIGPKSARPRNKSPLWQSLESSMAQD